jgi:Concanavalin A-like lectin/glucanases superfamily
MRKMRFGAGAAALIIVEVCGGKASAQLPSSYWQFNESNGSTITDSTGSSNGTLSGSATRISGAPGLGNALQFNNTAGAAAFTSTLAASSGITIEALIRPEWLGNNDYDSIIRKDVGGIVLLGFQNDNNGNGFSFPAPSGIQGPVLSFGLPLTSGYTELDMPLDGLLGRPTLAGLKNGNWHHVVATYDSTTGAKRIAIDGVFVYSATFSAGTLINSTAGQTTIGGRPPSGSESFTGGVDEVAYYQRALSDAEVTSHYTNFAAGRSYFASVTAPEPGTLALALLGSVCLIRRRAIRP